MPTPKEWDWRQLATRIPKPLHRRVKLHVTEREISLQEFVRMALEEKLAGKAAS